VQPVKQALRRNPADLLQRLDDGRKARRRMCGCLDVVEADY
jgi:hypothetical protein